MIVTTAGRTNEILIEKAKSISSELGAKYVCRQKRSVAAVMERENDDCMIVGKERLELYPYGEKEPFFFHPNSSMFRVKRLQRGEKDPFIEATKLASGMSLLDCTLGLASDSIVASFWVGSSGKVIGVEENPYSAYIVEKGLEDWDSGLEVMNEAMRMISVIQNHSLEVMQRMDDNSFDCVYFDPMFEERLLDSDGIRGLSHFAKDEGLSKEMIHQALRVARNRVVLRDHYRSTRFERFGFTVNRRKTAKFHFGVIKKT